jgi:hypothetical protein
MNDSVAAINRANATIAEQTQALEVFTDLKRDAPLAEEYQEKLAVLLPKKEELLGITRAIDAIARTRNVTFKFSFSGGESPGSSGVAGNISFSIEAEGSYENVRDFLTDLESKSTRFVMMFDNITFKTISGGYRVNVQGKTFFRSS